MTTTTHDAPETTGAGGDTDPTSPPFRIVTSFPPTPPLVTQALRDLATVKTLAAGLGGRDDTKTLEQLDAFGDIDCLPRPWEPATCTKTIRAELWPWLDDVAAWINHQYIWDAERAIPECWPLHPRIAHELPVVACLRVTALLDIVPDKLEDWHRYTLPMFIDRFTADNHCQPGKHVPWSGTTRQQRFAEDPARGNRHRLFHLDTGPTLVP